MKKVETADLNAIDGVGELNTLLKIPLNNIGVKDFYWNTNLYIEAAITENRCFIIKKDSMIMGAMIMESRNPPDHQNPNPSLAIGTLSVRPKFRRNGIGILLVNHAKEMAQKENKRLVVESFLEFRQLSFYKRLGFKEGLSKEYHGKPYHFLFIDPTAHDLQSP